MTIKNLLPAKRLTDANLVFRMTGVGASRPTRRRDEMEKMFFDACEFLGCTEWVWTTLFSQVFLG